MGETHQVFHYDTSHPNMIGMGRGSGFMCVGTVTEQEDGSWVAAVRISNDRYPRWLTVDSEPVTTRKEAEKEARRIAEQSFSVYSRADPVARRPSRRSKRCQCKR
jgi:hypothetical protein